MTCGHTDIIKDLEHLRNLTSSDFIALATLLEHKASMRWEYALGNSNNRYQQMAVINGQGLAGSAWRIGRWMKLDDTHPRFVQEQRECPLMLAEQLQAAAVFPLLSKPAAKMTGLLFMGKRTQSRYEHDEIMLVHERLGLLCERTTNSDSDNAS